MGRLWRFLAHFFFTMLNKILLAGVLSGSLCLAAAAEVTDLALAKNNLTPAPTPTGLLLKKGDRLAICGEIANFKLDLSDNKMTVSDGHNLLSAKDGVFTIRSLKYPFCSGAPMGLAADWFPTMGKYRVTWGEESQVFTGEQLTKGVNLAVEFVANPFSTRFAMIDAAVASKQAFETRGIKTLFCVPGDKVTNEQITEQTEKVLKNCGRQHAALDNVIRVACAPVTYTIKITAE
jgi:hypothetical protein